MINHLSIIQLASFSKVFFLQIPMADIISFYQPMTQPCHCDHFFMDADFKFLLHQKCQYGKQIGGSVIFDRPIYY